MNFTFVISLFVLELLTFWDWGLKFTLACLNSNVLQTMIATWRTAKMAGLPRRRDGGSTTIRCSYTSCIRLQHKQLQLSCQLKSSSLLFQKAREIGFIKTSTRTKKTDNSEFASLHWLSLAIFESCCKAAYLYSSISASA